MQIYPVANARHHMMIFIYFIYIYIYIYIYIPENVSCYDDCGIAGGVVGCHNENKSPVPPLTTDLVS